MRTKIISELCMIMLLIIVLSGTAAALGVTPARTSLDFSAGNQENIKINIINNEHEDMRLLIHADGKFSRYLKIEEDTVSMSSDERMKTINAKLIMGGEMKKSPGQNEIMLRILKLPEGSSEGSGNSAKVSATVEVVHQIRVNVPYPGVYLEVPDIYINTPSDGSSADFTIPVFNRGEKSIRGINGEIRIYNPDGKMVGTVETGSLSLKGGAKGKLNAEYTGEGGRGRYRAVITIDYAGKTAEIEKEFFMGSQLIDITGVTVDKFSLGSIAKFNIILDSRWNQQINDVYADVTIRDSSNKLQTKFKTPTTDVGAESTGILNAYWDTGDAEPGEYTMHVVLHYTRLAKEKLFTMDVGFDSIRIRGGNAAGAVVSGGDGADEGSLLIAGVALLVVINTIILIMIYRSKRRR